MRIQQDVVQAPFCRDKCQCDIVLLRQPGPNLVSSLKQLVLIGQVAPTGGIWDTKHLIRCLPEVARCLDSTSLGPLYEALGHAGTPQPEVRRSPCQFVAFTPGTPLTGQAHHVTDTSSCMCLLQHVPCHSAVPKLQQVTMIV